MPFYHCTAGAGGGGGNSDAIIEGTIASITTNASKVKPRIFAYDTTLTSFIGRNVTEIGDTAFRQATSITTLELGSLTKIDSYGLYQVGASGSTFDLDLNGATVGSQAIQASKVRYVTGTWSSAGASALRQCTSLKKVEFNLNQLPTYFLYGDTALEELYLSYDQGVVSVGSNALTNVPNTCKVYVPSALVSSYQADSNWSRFDIQALPT